MTPEEEAWFIAREKRRIRRREWISNHPVAFGLSLMVLSFLLGVLSGKIDLVWRC